MFFILLNFYVLFNFIMFKIYRILYCLNLIVYNRGEPRGEPIVGTLTEGTVGRGGRLPRDRGLDVRTTGRDPIGLVIGLMGIGRVRAGETRGDEEKPFLIEQQPIELLKYHHQAF
jgi:hypothetical protein